jgi:hypothetical protein
VISSEGTSNYILVIVLEKRHREPAYWFVDSIGCIECGGLYTFFGSLYTYFFNTKFFVHLCLMHIMLLNKRYGCVVGCGFEFEQHVELPISKGKK